MKQEELYTQLNTTMPKSKVPVRSLREGIGRQDVSPITIEQARDALEKMTLFGAQMLPGSDIAREIGASKLEPPIAEDIAEKKIIDPLLKGISTSGDVLLASAPLTGPGALGTAAVGATLKYGPKVFSALSEAVKKLKVKKAPGKDILNIISKTPGVKTDELKFTGLDKFLKDKKSVTKEEVDEYIQDSTVPIEENVYGADMEYNTKLDTILKERKVGLNKIDEIIKKIFKIKKDAGFPTQPSKYYDEERQQNIITSFEDADEVLVPLNETNLTTKQIQELENKVKPLTKSLEDKIPALLKQDDELRKKITELENPKTQRARFKNHTIDEKGGKNYREINFITKPKEGRFDQNHFPESNIFARVRVADRVDMQGKPTLHLEEVQSEYAAKSKGGKNVIPEGTEEKAIQLRNNIMDIEKEQTKIYDDLENKFNNETGFLKKISDNRLLKVEKRDKLKTMEGMVLSSILKDKNDPNLVLLSQNSIVKYKKLLGKKKIDEHEKLLQTIEKNDKEILGLEKQFDSIVKSNNRYTDLMTKKNQLQKEFSKAEDQLNYLPPALPYATKDNWYKYPIRRMLRDAAERGLDSISMTTGKVQYNRYSSPQGRTFEESKDILESLDYVKKNIDKFLKIKSRDALKNTNELGKEISNNKNIPFYAGAIARSYVNSIFSARKKVDDLASKGKFTDAEKKLVLKDEMEKVKRLFTINPATRVGVQYDTKYKSYLDDLAKRYNTTVDKTRVDGDKVSNVESGGVVRGDKAEAYRLKITPEMRKEILEKGVVKFKTGGYIEERT